MKRKFPLLIAGALVSMAAGIFLYQFLQSRVLTGPADTGQAPLELPSIPLTDLENRDTLLGDWKSDILLVNFWAPWCAPCRREIPALIEINNDYASKGVRLLGIAFDSAPQVRRFADDHEIDYPLFLAVERAAMYNTAFGNRSGSLPYTAMLDRDFRIVFEHNGELSSQQISEALDKLL